MRRLFFISAFAALLPTFALAADFTASIENNHIGQGENFTLRLTLSGAKADSGPDISALKKSFTLISETQSSNATGAPNTPNLSVDWLLTLLPNAGGHLTIPEVTIQTAAGKLSTTSLALDVDQPASKISSQVSKEGSTVSISAKVNMETPYRNQPIQYTLKSVVRGMISKVALDDITIANAIVERQGKPDVYDQVENGVPERVVEIHYIITPMQTGKMTIPSAVLKGEIETPALTPMVDPFGGQFMMSPQARQAVDFFSAYGGQPFSIASNTVTLEVRPPAAAMDPWLPLRSLKIREEDVDASQLVHVGEPLSRKITLRAEGAVGSQLPDLTDRQDSRDFKVYADKPEMGEDVDRKKEAISGWRTESYSLIPQNAGRMVLPAIKVKWWDIANNKVAVAELPERVVNVLPAAGTPGPVIAGPVVAMEKPAERSAPAQLPSLQIGSGTIWNGIIAVLLAAFAGVLFWRWRSMRATVRPGAGFTEIVVAMLQTEGMRVGRMLEKVHTVKELKAFLQSYAHQRWGNPENGSLEEIFPEQSTRPARQEGDGEIVTKAINAALYANATVDLADLKKRSRRILTIRDKKVSAARNGGEKLPLLNPS